jgi:hypothetical protein
MEGFIAAMNLTQAKICVTGATKSTVVRVYLAYMDKHPKLFDVPKQIGLGLALRESYPCRAQ